MKKSLLLIVAALTVFTEDFKVGRVAPRAPLIRGSNTARTE